MWVLLGVLLGAFLSPFVDYLKSVYSKKTRIKKLKFELDAFYKIIEEWEVELTKLIQHIASHGKQIYVPYIPLARIFTPTLAEMNRSGDIYDYIDDYKDISLLMWLNLIYSDNGENYFNNKMKEHEESPNELSKIALLYKDDFDKTKKIITKIISKI